MILTTLAVAFTVLASLGCTPSGTEVVVYTSVDEVFSAPILKEFERQKGIRVRARYDVEADKTTGLYHLLVAEHQSGRPRADVFWNSEVSRTLLLAEQGVLQPYASPSAADLPSEYRSEGDLWAGFGVRARIIIYNRRRVPEAELPESIQDLTHERWRDEAGIAHPLFGTTLTHVGALWATLGKERTEAYFRALLANGVKVLAGNSTVRDRVASGEIKIGLTDTDDAVVALRKRLPVGIVFPDQKTLWSGREVPLGTFVIPNTVSLVQGAPNAAEGQKLIDYLLSRETEAELAKSASAQIPVRQGVDPPEIPGVPVDLRRMNVSFADVTLGVQDARQFLEQPFVR